MTNMEPTAFVALVRRMRTAQKAYFASRSKANLQAAKGLEDDVDAALAAGVQPTLFDGPRRIETGEGGGT